MDENIELILRSVNEMPLEQAYISLRWCLIYERKHTRHHKAFTKWADKNVGWVLALNEAKINQLHNHSKGENHGN
jgi:hypothetical protein